MLESDKIYGKTYSKVRDIRAKNGLQFYVG